MTLHDFPINLPYIYLDDNHHFKSTALMTDTHATVIRPRKIQARAWVIFLAVGTAVAIPILPLRFLASSGPDLFGGLPQAFESSKSWVSSLAGARKDPAQKDAGKESEKTISPAEHISDLEEVAQQLNAQILRSPKDPSLENRLGLVYLSLGEEDAACAHFDKAVDLGRNGISEMSARLSALRVQGKSGESTAILLDASKLSVELSAAHSNLARIYERRGEHDKVVAELDMLNRDGALFDNQASDANSSSPGDHSRLRPEVARLLARAEALMQSRQLPQAAAEFRHVLAADAGVAMAHHRLGTILAVTGNPASAVDELEIAGRLDPTSRDIQNDLGRAYQMLGMSQQAVSAFQRALAIDESSAEAAMSLGSLYAASGRLDEAARVLTIAVRRDPRSPSAHNNLGTVLSLQGQYPQAQYEFHKAIELAPTMTSAHYGLGLVLMNTKNYLAAVKSFKQALSLNPQFAEAQTKIEEAYRKAGVANGGAGGIN